MKGKLSGLSHGKNPSISQPSPRDTSDVYWLRCQSYPGVKCHINTPPSVDWFKEKSTGDLVSYLGKRGYPVGFLLNQSHHECRSLLRETVKDFHAVNVPFSATLKIYPKKSQVGLGFNTQKNWKTTFFGGFGTDYHEKWSRDRDD